MRKLLALLLLVACDPASPPPAGPDAGVTADDPSDPLSMPKEPLFASAAFHPAESCAACHPGHVAEWRSSVHAYAMLDPLFRALVAVRSADFQGARDTFCTQCHSAIAARATETKPGFRFEALSPIALEGVTCEACHKISGVTRLYNAGHTLDPSGPVVATIADPLATNAHASAASPLFADSKLCGSCHNVIEFTGVPLERPYDEWLASPAGAAAQPCQSCHMRSRTGTAAIGGPAREIHDHRFVGVDLPLEDGALSPSAREQLRGAIAELLRDQAELSLSVPATSPRGAQLDVVITVRNKIEAHSFPTGSTFHRQFWLELEAKDASGASIYRTGDLDAAGDLRDHWSGLDPYGDHDLVRFGSRFIDARGAPTLFPWRASEHLSTSIPAGYARTQTLFVDTSSAARGPLSISARLRFRSVPPFLLRALSLGDAAERLEIFEVATSSVVVVME